MKTITFTLEYKDIIIGFLFLCIIGFVILKIIIVNAYYQGQKDTKNIINGALGSDISNYKKINS